MKNITSNRKMRNYIYALLIFFSFFSAKEIKAQSTNCSTATNINLSTGNACVNGTNAGAITDNTLYGGCNTVPVDMVWYTYVANGSNNTFTITPNTLTNAEIVLYTGACPATGTLQTCHVAAGTAVLTTTWGMTLGEQVWVGVASNGGTDGTFQLCINSTPPAPGAGHTCAQSIPICNSTFSQASMAANASGQAPNCFGSAPQEDVWFKFTITQAGNLAWTATPNTLSDEFDWCLWDISAGCPGTVACCNYNYAGGSSQGFGMQAQTGTVACGYNTASNAPKKEFCGPLAVTCGKTYAIQISNYLSTGTGFSFSFASSTCLINSTSSFTPTPSLICGTTLTAAITNASTGGCAAVWSFGDGSANYTGTTPPNHTYNSPGTYAITENITGACPSTATQFVQLLAPLTMTATATPVSCGGLCVGTASVTAVSGGDGIYTYSWNPTVSTADNISNLCSGTYSVTVSNAKCGTSVTQSVTVATPQPLTLTPTPTNASCGNNNGSISLVATGGTSPYTYSNNGGAFSGTTNYTTLGAGTYTLTVKDHNGCDTSVVVTLTQTGSPTVTVTSQTICPGGTATLTASGATTYSWSAGVTPTTGSLVTVSPGATTSYTVTGTTTGCTGTATSTVTIGGAVTITVPSATICAGASTTLTASGGTTYTWSPATGLNTTTGTSVIANPIVTTTYTIHGAVGTCSGTTTAIVTIIPFTASVSTLPTTCTGSTGSATATAVSGGTAPYTYTWTTTPIQTGQTASNLAQGTYTVAITDVNGCLTAATGTVGGQTFTWSLSAASTNPKCTGSADGTSTVTVINPGASTFTYSWSTTPAQTTVNTTSLSAGTYTVFVSDNNGCSSNTTVTLIDPAPFTATVNTSPTMCSGSTGSATATPTSGGIAPYSYTWVTNPVQTNSVAINLAQGSYSVVVIDANGCSAVPSGSVQSTGFTWVPVATSSPTQCFGSNDGTATVTINNSPAGNTYTYLWTPSAQTNSVVTNLSAINYTVTVTDNNACTSTASVTVTQPTQLTATALSTPAICTSNNGTASAYPIGGTGPYAYSWSVTNPVQTTQTAINLTQGQYIALITDVNTCTTTATTLVGDTTDLTVTASPSPDLCSKGVGKAIAHPNGQSPYIYVWTTTPADTTQIADSLHIGTYSVTVTDALGCIKGASTTVVNQNDVLSAEFTTAPAGTINAEDPISLNITTNPNWNIDSAYLSNGVLIDQNSFPYTFTQYGDYTATYYFTSNNGCKDTVTYLIIVKDYMTLYIPNTFTPNGDGKNDNFEAQGTFIDTFEMLIFDRWGVLVKKMENIATTWDGSKNGGPAPQDTYVYKGTATDIFGKHVSFHGQINLVR